MEYLQGLYRTESINLLGALQLAGYPDGSGTDTKPYAYLNYVTYDEQMVFDDAGWVRVTTAAEFEPGQEGLPNNRSHEHLAFSSPIEITQNGYIYIWVGNQSQQTKVWFDDLTVTHRQNGLVVQSTDYGVWGDVMREQKSDESVYRFGYQGQFAEKDEETGWSHFELREYDPVIGRWMVPDPEYQFWSPYVAMGNWPTSGVDVMGSRVFFFSKAQALRAALNINGIFKSLFGIENAVTIVEKVVHGVNKTGYYLQFSSNVDISRLSKRRQFVILSFKDALDANTDILGEIVPPSTKAGKATVGDYKGYTFSPNHFVVPNNLPDFDPNTISRFTIGSQTLHELLWHISPLGRSFDSAGFTSRWLYSVFRAPLGS
ncbi:MAG TPA: RHS repeat-associated core domain-containing protein, partial [Cyclobacteriaceae bacterium]|nr:RHS repeat-associated core domain-containing protein [Cyclobacteriaceae bacterium]